MKAASLRLGSQGLRTSFDDHLLIIGDAAGHIDPLTGEGIHTAIMVRCCACWSVVAAKGSTSHGLGDKRTTSCGQCHHLVHSFAVLMQDRHLNS